MPSKKAPEGGQRIAVDFHADEGVGDKIDAAFVERVLREALEGRAIAGPFRVGVTVTTNEGIRDLNKRYRDVDSSTDVLSFPLLEFDRPETPLRLFPAIPGEPTALGDIVLSYPRAEEQAREYGHGIDREVAFLLVHSLMHLLGYDHEAAEEQRVMRAEEETVLARLGLTRENRPDDR